jgi:hypothetical protein
MNNFFSSLFKLNGANILKFLSGAGSTLLSIAGIASQIPGLPSAVTNTAGIIVGIATVLGAHGFHIATPPNQ